MNPGDSSHNTNEFGSQSHSGPSVFRFAEPDEQERLPRAPKVHHKKSRTGCRTCRSRRVKCDEIHPACGNCTRRNIPCLYDAEGETRADQVQATSSRDSTTTDSREGGEDITTSHAADIQSPQLIESRSRRQLELKLLHTYNTLTAKTLVVDDIDGVSKDAWVYEAPKLAFENEALLSALFAFTALHLIDLEPSNEKEMRRAYHNYWHTALQEHHRELQDLNPANFNAACITSTFMRLTAFVMLRDRSLTPYTPPNHWYSITRGAMQVFAVAYKWMPFGQDLIATRLTERMPFIFDEEAKFAPLHRERFPYLLASVNDDSLEYVSADDRDAYEKTISYLGGICLTTEITGHSNELFRRLVIMPYLVPARFGELMEATQPRALVILAHYFALISKYREYWWIDRIGGREVVALASVVPQEWQPMMSWPLATVSEQLEADRFEG